VKTVAFGASPEYFLRVRARFFVSLGTLLIGCLLLVSSMAFAPGVALWVGLGLGLVLLALSLAALSSAVHRRELGEARELRLRARAVRVWPLLASSLLGVALWQVAQVGAFAAGVAKWLSFANGWVVSTLAAAALIVHEISCERVVHFVEVVDRHRAGPATG
jgi:sterol desaturase/sphingolipid hydroxylase (fatty acid hydroxylase superfamily)